jgi:2-haloacid dehalogenase
MNRPSWVLFDLNGTLLDPRPVATAIASPDAELIVVEALRDAVTQGMVDTLSGEHRPFLTYIENALRRQALLHHLDLDEAAVDRLTAAMATMPPFSDSSDATRTLSEAGIRVGVLTNSGENRARAALAHAGLSKHLEIVISADAIRAYKPATVLYRAAAQRLATPPSDIVLVSAHWWDITGAKRAGLRTAWISRTEMLMPRTPTPDYQQASLAAIATTIATA